MTKPQTMSENILIHTLKKIAVGRVDNGRPLAAEASRQIAREACLNMGINYWNIES